MQDRGDYMPISGQLSESLIKRTTGSKQLSDSETHLIRSDEEAIRVAQALAADFALDASGRDQKRRLPYEEIERYSLSGIWGITVPKEYGGADVSGSLLRRSLRLSQQPTLHWGKSRRTIISFCN